MRLIKNLGMWTIFWGYKIWIGDGLASFSSINRVKSFDGNHFAIFSNKPLLQNSSSLPCWVVMFSSSFFFIRWREERKRMEVKNWWSGSRNTGAGWCATLVIIKDLLRYISCHDRAPPLRVTVGVLLRSKVVLVLGGSGLLAWFLSHPVISCRLHSAWTSMPRAWGFFLCSKQ